LLVVFLTEVSAVRDSDIKELGYDSGDAPKVAGADCALQDLAELLDLDKGLDKTTFARCRGTVHSLHRRGEQGVTTGFTQQPAVSVEWTLVPLQVIPRLELERIYKDRGEELVALLAGPADQREVPLMKRAHRRHKTDKTAFASPALRERAHSLRRVEELHAQQARLRLESRQGDTHLSLIPRPPPF